MDLKKLTELLEDEEYPHRYVHKFIGLKTEAFLLAVGQLEANFPQAVRTNRREATGYVALTYELTADSAAEIIALWRATADLPDLKIIL